MARSLHLRFSLCTTSELAPWTREESNRGSLSVSGLQAIGNTTTREAKRAWFDALVFDPRFGGQNCLSVVQALQAELGNLMAVRQNLCVQIGVCWLQCLIELAGKELVIFKSGKTRAD